MQTGLKLLMRDGAVQVEFSPLLNSAQYDDLLAIVQGYARSATRDDLRRDLESAAKRWGVTVTFHIPVRLNRPDSKTLPG